MSALPANLSSPKVRAYQIAGDNMQPKLRSGDFLMIAPAKVYDGEGIYILDFDGDGVGSPYMAERVPIRGRVEVRIWHVNPGYSRHVIGMDDFNRAVCGKAVAEVRLSTSLAEIERRVAA